MSSPDKKKRNWKKILFHELVEYWINVAYLAVIFAVFTWYRRFLLSGYDITYTNYGVAVIEALILAKVIMIGDVLRLGRGLEDKPLIYPTLYKTVVFTIFVAVFTLMEHAIKGLLTGKGFTGGLAEYFEKGPHEFFAGCLMLFVAFIPFFSVKELGRVLGQDKITALFFRKRAEQ
jgi:prepilin signal peptidase PulO-like enzyme (type II secretory pathway)